jgi:hypothetical protein
VPLYGSYDTFLDHSRQTFNDQPRASDPSTQAAGFTTTCDASGCVAHWLRLTELADNPNAPSLFDYQWVNDRWVSRSECPTVTEVSTASGLSPSARPDVPEMVPARIGCHSR